MAIKNHNKRVAAALRQSLNHLWNGKGPRNDGKESCICYALSAGDDVDMPAVNAARKIIMRRLAPSSTLRYWLCNRVPSSDVDNYVNLQAHRKAWVEQLIVEFENKPD